MKTQFPKLLVFTVCAILISVSAHNAQNEGDQIKIGTSFEITSVELAEKRKFSIYLPASYYETEKRYPVLYLLDGEHYFFSTVSTVKALSGMGKMPETIVVAVHNTRREEDMTPPQFEIRSVPNGRADKFVSFFSKELLPKIEKEYRIVPLRIIVGHSHAGLFGLYALASEPGLFNWYLLLDSPLHLDNHKIIKMVEASLSNKPKISGRLSTAWVNYAWPSDSWKKISAETAASFRVSNFEVDGENHQSMYFLGIYKGLSDLFFDFQESDREIKTLPLLLEKEEKKNKQYGYAVPFSLPFLVRSAEHYLFAGDEFNGKLFIDKIIDSHGKGDASARLIAWHEDLVKNPLKETPQDLRLIPYPTASEIKPFLGTWRWDRFTVTFESKGAEIKSFTSQASPQGTIANSKNVLLRVLPDGTLEWGYDNMRHPRSALIIFRVRMVGGKLVGHQTFAAKMPPGMGSMPDTPAEFVRVK